MNVSILLLLFLTAATATGQTPFWAPSTGPYGGRVIGIAYTRAGTLFAATSHGLFRSTDDGERWNATALQLREDYVQSVVTTSTGAIIATSFDHFVRSTDDGVTWTLLPEYPKPNWVANSASPYLFGIGPGFDPELYRSSDDGLTWQRSTMPRTYQVYDLGPELLVVNAYASWLLSRDSGQSWIGLQWPARHLSAVGRMSRDTIFAAGLDSSGARTIVRSTDNGITWSDALAGLEGRNVITMRIDGARRMIAVLTDGVARWSEAESRWTVISSFAVDRGNEFYFRNDVIATSPGRLSIIAATERGTFRSTDDGVTWQNTSDGMNALAIACVATLSNGTILAGGDREIFRSTDLGMSWSPTVTVSRTNSIVTLSNGDILAGGFDALLRSTDNGATWAGLREADSLYLYSVITTPAGLVAAVAIPRPTTEFIVTTSMDEGTTWSDAPIRSQNQGETLSSDPVGDLLLATGGRVRRSSDRGATWHHVVEVDEYVSSILPLRDGSIMIGTSEGQVILFDSANSRLLRSGPIDTAIIIDLEIDRAQRVYAATGAGKIFVGPSDGSGPWENVSAGIGVRALTRIHAHPSGFLFLATEGGSVQRSVERVTGVELDAPAILEMNLSMAPAPICRAR